MFRALPNPHAQRMPFVTCGNPKPEICARPTMSFAKHEHSNHRTDRRAVIDRCQVLAFCALLAGCDLAANALVQSAAMGRKYFNARDKANLTLDDVVPENTIAYPNALFNGDVVSIAFVSEPNGVEAVVVVTTVAGRTPGGDVLISGRPGSPVRLTFDDVSRRYRVDGGNRDAADKRPSREGDYVEVRGALRVRKF